MFAFSRRLLAGRAVQICLTRNSAPPLLPLAQALDGLAVGSCTSLLAAMPKPLSSLRGFAALPTPELVPGPSSIQPKQSMKGIPPIIEVPLYNLAMEQVGTYPLPGEVFGQPVRLDILHRVVRWQRAKKQQGTHKTKTRGEVRGGGRKPHKQKGTGMARFGSIRAPQRRGGGVTFGPVVRSHAHDLPRKVRRLGLKCALSAKAREGRLLVFKNLVPAEPKTRWMDKALDTMLEGAPRRSIVLVDAGKEGKDGGAKLRRVCTNLAWVEVLPSEGLNVYSILQRDYLAVTQTAIEQLVERLTRPLKR